MGFPETTLARGIVQFQMNTCHTVFASMANDYFPPSVSFFEISDGLRNFA